MSHTEIIYILDRSGSMSHLRQAAITGFNDFLASQREVPGEARLTLVLFNAEQQFIHDAAPLAQISGLTELTYRPLGGTALLDTLGEAITKTRERLALLNPEARPAKVVFAIFTDGQENASRRFSRAHIADLVRLHQSGDGWEFLFLAANLDAFAEGGSMNMRRSSSSDVRYDHDGILESKRALSRKISAYRKESGGYSMSDQERHDFHTDLSDLVQEENDRPAPPRP